MKKSIFLFIVSLSFLLGCTVVEPGQVAVRKTLGRLKDPVLLPGLYFFNPLITSLVKVPIQTTNLQVDAETLPTKEGLNVKVDFAILYRLKPDYAKVIIQTIGLEYENTIIYSVLKSAAPNIASKYYAKDLYTSAREQIGKEIATEMSSIIGDRGIVLEAVLLKSIKLPNGLANSIEQKLEAEQDAQRMEFVLTKEKKEAERKVIEAEGIKKSQLIIAEGLTPSIIQYKSIDAFIKMSSSPNAKIIITNGKAPFLINQDVEPK